MAKLQSIVLTKKTAKARAPAGVCSVAATGMTGGRSPGSALGPVVGTSAGTVGRGGTGRVGDAGCVAAAVLIAYVGGVNVPLSDGDLSDEAALVHAANDRAAMIPTSPRTPAMIAATRR